MWRSKSGWSKIPVKVYIRLGWEQRAAGWRMVHGCLFGNVFGRDFPLLVLLPLEGNVWGQKVLHMHWRRCRFATGWEKAGTVPHSHCDPFLGTGRDRGIHWDLSAFDVSPKPHDKSHCSTSVPEEQKPSGKGAVAGGLQQQPTECNKTAWGIFGKADIFLSLFSTE